MKIDFTGIQEKALPEFKNGVGEFYAKMYSNDLGKILHGRLEPGNTIGYHIHESSSEIIFILSGKAICNYDNEEEILMAGDCHYCPKGHSHGLKCADNEAVTFFAVVPEQ